MSNLEQDVITTENEILKLEVDRLKKEIEFMNKIFKDHPSAVVYNLERFTMNSEPLWIDTHLVTIQELQKLDQDDHVKDLLHSKTSSRYNDDDW